MNKYILYTGILILLGFFSCRKDLGNYKYTDIDQVEISEINELYEVLTLSDLVISPTVSYTSGQSLDKDQYTYEWFAVDSVQNLDSLKMKKLGNQLDLKYKVSLPTKRDPYQLFFRMKDKNTGKQWVKKVKLLVNSEIGNGWLILHEKSQKAQLDILNYKSSSSSFSYYRNILDGIEIEGKPKLVYYVGTFDLYNRARRDQVYIGTDKKTYSFNVTEQMWNQYRLLNQEIVRPLESDFHAVKFRAVGNLISKQNYCLGSDGKLMFEDNNTGTSYSIGVNRLQAVGEVKISPYFAEKTSPSDMQPFAMMFDTANKRFIAQSGTSNMSMTMMSTNPVMIDPNKVGMDLLFMDYTVNNKFYALLFNKDIGSLKLLRFDNMSSIMMPSAFDEVTKLNDIQQAEFYSIDPNYGYLFYAIGSKVFQYDPFKKEHKLLIDLGTRKISLIKFQRFIDKISDTRYKEYGKKLIVGSYDPADADKSGKIEFYRIGLSALPEKEVEYDGFGKVTDVSYRE